MLPMHARSCGCRLNAGGFGRWRLVLLLLAVCGPLVAPRAAVEVTADSAAAIRREVRVHDPSTIVRCKDEYWLFGTGPGLRSWRSKDLVHWQAGPRVFEALPAWAKEAVPANRGGLWAPDVIYHEGRFLLYYSVSTWGRNTSAIGLVTNPTLDPADPNFQWTDQGWVVRSTSKDDFNAIDPGVTRDAEGNLWLVFGSYWSGIKLVQLDPRTGKPLAGARLHALAHHSSIEAACVYRRSNWYYLFVNWGQCCLGVQSTYNIRVGRSPAITGPYVDRAGRELLAGGGTLVASSAGRFIGPGHAGIFNDGDREWFSFHFYDQARGGAPTLAVAPLSWSADGWPVLQHPCAGPAAQAISPKR
jgi:arabinan endo-1,5-alpha-L-arabinosidase